MPPTDRWRSVVPYERSDRAVHQRDAKLPLSASGRHLRPLVVVLGIVVLLLAAEVTVAIATGSLALLSDAGHLATDVVGISLAVGAAVVARRHGPSHRSTFGWYRLEVLAALANAAILVGVAVFVAVEAIRRAGDPHPVSARPLVIVAVVALAANLVCARLLQQGARDSINLEGARLEVLADAVGSIGVLVAGVVIEVTGWTTIDTIVALGISAWILPRAVRLARRSLGVLLQLAPAGIDVEGVEQGLLDLPGVTGVHDLHAWTLTSGMDVVSVHIAADRAVDQHALLHDAQERLRELTGIDHATVQIEPCSEPGCTDPHPPGW